MRIFPLHKKKDELILVLDIHSASVGGALFFAGGSQIPRIVASLREFIPAEENVTPERIFTLLLSTLKSVLDKISNKKVGTPSRIFCVFGAPWHVSQTRIIKLSKDTPFVFTEKLADELTQKEIALVEAEYREKYKEMSGTLRPIELKNVKTKLNGYETERPVGKTAMELEMNMFISISSEKMCTTVEEIVERHFPVKTIKFSSFTMASFAALRDMYHERENFLLIHISGEITDITMVKKGSLREATSYPLGINTILRGIASQMHITSAEARSIMSLHRDGHAGESITQSIEPVLLNLKKEWLKKFQEALANLSNDISIPSLLYLTTNQDAIEFFTEIIKGEQFNQYTLSEAKFEIIPCNVDTLHSGVTFTGDSAIFDAYLALDSIYINRFFN